MSKQAVIGTDFTFQAYFLDGTNTPFAPAIGPNITVFSFSLAGAKNVLVNADAMDPATPVEPGRYTYVYSIPTTFSDGQMLYAEITGEDGLGNNLYQAKEVVMITELRGNSGGLCAKFVEGG